MVFSQNEIKWRLMPFIKLIAPFAVGIGVGIYHNEPHGYLWLVVLAVLVGIIAVAKTKKIISKPIGVLAVGVLVNVLMLVCGYQLTMLKTHLYHPTHYVNAPTRADFLLVQVAEQPAEKNKSIKANCKILKGFAHQKTINIKGTFVAYFAKDSSARSLKFGDYLCIKNNLQTIGEATNPAAFDYKTYLKHHNIHHQIYLQNQNWQWLGHEKHFNILKIANDCQQWCVGVLKKNIVSHDESAFACALLVGYKNDLSADIVYAYSSTGTVHILAVSGLHVGIIFILLNLLLKKMEQNRRQNFVRVAIIILFLWAYAFVTGLSASVLRSALMFSLILIAQLLNRSSNIYNILAGSAFLLLCYNPYNLVDVGFQLSYLAVAGIVYFQPKIEHWFYFNNKIANYLWSMTSVSLAAQLVTFPLMLYYFHQFPNTFLLSNLFAIPLSSGILVGLVGLILVSWIGFLAKIIGFTLKYAIMSLNFLIFQVDSLPFSQTTGIFITIIETYCLYVLVLGLVLALVYGSKRSLGVVFLLSIGFLSYNIFENMQSHEQKKLIVYNIKNQSMVAAVGGRKISYIASDSVLNDRKTWLLFLNGHFCSLNLNQISKSSNVQSFFEFNQKRLAVLNQYNQQNFRFDAKLPLDYLVVGSDILVDFKHIKQQFSPQIIIFDSSNSKKYTKKMTIQCQKIRQPCYDVSTKGAFVAEL